MKHLFLTLPFLLMPFAAQAQIFVDAGNSTATTKNGQTWATALDSLHLAINASSANDTIVVKGGGLFKPTNKADRTKSFTIDKALVIYGGFLGTETGTHAKDILAARPANFVKDTLSGDIGTIGTDTDNSQNVVKVTAAGAILDGFVIRGGYGSDGAGVNMSANSTLRNLEIYNNTANTYGGGVDMSAGTLTHSIIRNNNAGTTILDYGGGVRILGGTLSHSIIHNNEASVGAGGVFIGSATITNCVIYSNSGGVFGGGIAMNDNATALIVNNTLYNNTPTTAEIHVYVGNDNSKLYNNLIYGVFNSVSDNIIFQYNLVKGNSLSQGVSGTAPSDLTGNVATNTNPFASTTEGDANFLHLSATSYAAQAGLNSQATWAKDLAGAARIQGGRVDMGAYESDATPKTIYVDADATGAKDGTTWAKAYDQLSTALTAALNGDTVFVKGGGTFKPTATTTRSIFFTIDKAVSVYGGFLGTETGTSAAAILAKRPANFVKDTLSGDIGTAGTATDNSYHVVFVPANGAVLDGFVVTGGQADGATASKYHVGAGIYMTGNSTLRNLEVHNNTTSTSTSGATGGGVHMTAGTLTHSAIHNNTARSGGGVSLTDGNFNLFNCVIYSNTATTSGGGIYMFNSSSLIVNNTIYNNTSSTFGGGILLGNIGGDKLYNNLIYGNTTSEDTKGYEVFNTVETTIFQYNLVKGANVGAAIKGKAFSATPGCIFTTTNPFASTTSTDANFLRLSVGSPALDVGLNAQATWDLDLAGRARTTDDDATSGAVVDMGAYEGTASSALYVDAGNTTASTKDGTTWANAYDSLNLAIAGASAGDTLFVKGGGTFKPTAGTSRDKIFTINKAVLIYGGFAGTETGTADEILAARPVNFVKPTLSGDIGTAISTIGDFTDTGYDDNSKGVVKVTVDGAVLDGFAIVAANNTGNGGGVNMTGNSTLRNLEIYGNIANDGGGIDLTHGTITHSVLYDNKARSAGGGVAIKQRGRIINNVIRGNTADASWDSGGGGGLYVPGHNISTYKIEVLSNTVYNNTASGGHGGGITFDHYHSNTIVAANNIFYDNKAPAAGKKAEINVFGANHNVTFSHNLVKGANATANIWGTFASGTPSCVFTTTSPFVSTTEADAGFLHLSSTSSARNVGLNSRVSWALDLAGLERIEGGTVDMGAYEAPMAAITGIALNATSVAHLTAADVKVADISATHVGLASNPTITYSLKNANATTDTFKVVGSELRTNKAIDYAKLNGAHSPITLVASHTLSGGATLTKEQEVTIAITGTVPPALATLEALGVHVYPNPTTGLLHLRSAAKVKRLRLLNASGSVVLRSRRTNTLNISNLPAGTYLLELVIAVGNLRIPVLRR